MSHVICQAQLRKIMNNAENLTLIEGSFSCEEAKEILMNLFSTKMQFHKMKNFSSLERFGKGDEHALNRISKLKESTEILVKLLEKAHLEKKKLIIHSNINIVLDDDH